jgi:hypothetical protein
MPVGDWRRIEVGARRRRLPPFCSNPHFAALLFACCRIRTSASIRSSMSSRYTAMLKVTFQGGGSICISAVFPE